MDSDPIRWVVMRTPPSVFHVFSGPQSRLEIKDIPEHQRLGYEAVAIVDSEAEAWQWVEVHRQRHLP